ncbi:hypothetical protein LJR090_002537 [Bosea sp. LjRoot90]|uniref:hypothetical protein n=1 Tax=Bosea sp. LjRoot90 TaxID=3342342 RepID=UPI003ECD02F8
MAINDIGKWLAFDRYLSKRILDLPLEQQDYARAVIGEQQLRWQELFGAFSGAFRDRSSAAVAVISSRVRGRVGENSPSMGKKPGAGISVQAPYPLLEQASFLEQLAFVKESPWQALAILVRRTRHLIAMEGELRAEDEDQQLRELFSDVRFAPVLAEVSVALENLTWLSEMNSSLQDFQQSSVQMLTSAKLVWDSEVAAIGKTSVAAAEKLAVSVSEHTEEIATNKKAFDDMVAGATEQIKAARKQATENGILQGANTLWSNKAFWHGFRFWFGLFALFGLLGVGLYWAADAGPNFLSKLPKKADGELPYATVALMIACLVAAGWALRFLGRFVTENMTLQADAAQREVMIQTYLALVGDEKALMEQTDRTLILNAIFRPLPGHQSEDVAPPTLLDIVKSASGKG